LAKQKRRRLNMKTELKRGWKHFILPLFKWSSLRWSDSYSYLFSVLVSFLSISTLQGSLSLRWFQSWAQFSRELASLSSPLLVDVQTEWEVLLCYPYKSPRLCRRGSGETWHQPSGQRLVLLLQMVYWLDAGVRCTVPVRCHHSRYIHHSLLITVNAY